MSCAPCFLAKPEHCPRGLACVEMLEPALVHQIARMFLARPEKPRPRQAFVPAPRLSAEAEKPAKKRARRARVTG
jgi:hypothetical protein